MNEHAKDESQEEMNAVEAAEFEAALRDIAGDVDSWSVDVVRGPRRDIGPRL